MRKIIDLKIVQPHFDDVASGRKKRNCGKTTATLPSAIC